MWFRATLLASLMALSAIAQELGHKVGCGTPEPSSDSFLEAELEMIVSEATEATEPNVKRWGNVKKQKDIHVPVHIHSISSTEEKLLSPDAIQAQFDVAAKVFAAYGIKLHLLSTVAIVNKRWAIDSPEMDYKKALRKGGYQDLNLYYVEETFFREGFCYSPDAVTPESEDFWLDGCVIMSTTVPGGSHPNHNKGLATVHEIGHWFGLRHTWGWSCEDIGDGISDTPAQMKPTFGGCPQGRDSCPNKPGLDPIHNYMDYSDDSCYEEFTPGQVRRMHDMWNKFRSNH